MAETPKTRTTNSPQRVLKTVPQAEEITVNIVKQVAGGDMEQMLQGVGAFVKSFPPEDRYIVSIKVDRVFGEEQHPEN